MTRLMFGAALLAATALGAASRSATAADNGFYLGGGIAQSDYRLANPTAVSGLDDEDTGWKLIAGFRPLDSFAVEVNYADHGAAAIPGSLICPPGIGLACPARFELSAKTLSAFAVGFATLPFVDLFGKVGAASWKVEARANSTTLGGFSTDEDDVDFAWGAGVQARFGSLAGRLEYERFRVVNDDDLDAITLSVTWTIL
jgi:opacity protein-like surface antigen